MLGLGAYDSDEDSVSHDRDADVVQQEVNMPTIYSVRLSCISN
jgi:hypothetical protein